MVNIPDIIQGYFPDAEVIMWVVVTSKKTCQQKYH